MHVLIRSYSKYIVTHKLNGKRKCILIATPLSLLIRLIVYTIVFCNVPLLMRIFISFWYLHRSPDHLKTTSIPKMQMAPEAQLQRSSWQLCTQSHIHNFKSNLRGKYSVTPSSSTQSSVVTDYIKAGGNNLFRPVGSSWKGGKVFSVR